ncbi:MAG: hypothetical protein ACR2QF_12170 [Geminicoccaceae bacterium]
MIRTYNVEIRIPGYETRKGRITLKGSLVGGILTEDVCIESPVIAQGTPDPKIVFLDPDSGKTVMETPPRDQSGKPVRILGAGDVVVLRRDKGQAIFDPVHSD